MRSQAIVSSLAAGVALFLLSGGPGVLSAREAQAKACPASVYEQLRKPSSLKAGAVEITCDVTLDPKDVIARPIAFSGARASGVAFDCRGATLGTPDMAISHRRPTVMIRSLQARDGSWSVPKAITVKNCTIIGNMRLAGLGLNGQSEPVRRSSLKQGHTARAQAAAPTAIVLDNLDVVARGTLPLYLGPGVTGVTVSGSRFRGETTATALYLDAESGENRIIGNRFAVKTTRREQIAVDGSAGNLISGNVFEDAINGGIFLYRNAGEGGTIRHQPPQHNRIEGNRFRYEGMVRPRPAIWLNQRNGRTTHRLSAPDLPLGSSLDPRDLAKYNVVRDNRISGGWKGLIRNTDPTNEIVGND
ncbi:MAG: right-handed parallel beta-helix repeat-containing protein [Rhizobium sp.]|nr:right-handed parallel beta-helix repeat-containing protein [Rhizobium sp.]